VIEPLVEAQ
jgi:hypothetical protein